MLLAGRRHPNRWMIRGQWPIPSVLLVIYLMSFFRYCLYLMILFVRFPYLNARLPYCFKLFYLNIFFECVRMVDFLKFDLVVIEVLIICFSYIFCLSK